MKMINPTYLVIAILISWISLASGLTENMVHIHGKEFLMGSEDSPYPQDLESPIRKVSVESFLMDKYEVTNEEFAEFVSETQHVTDAELYGWSFVVDSFLSEDEDTKATEAVAKAPWWAKVRGATWKSPEGPDSNIETRMSHPVVHVSWNDANAFCTWRGSRLPSEPEWEYAARGGLEQNLFPWGNHRAGENKQHLANLFQGNFPRGDLGLDGFIGSAPVGSFPPNAYGLFDVSGNVWEWTTSGWRDHHPSYEDFLATDDKVCKGGSFMCHRSSCYRWRCAARVKNLPDSSSYNVGFRCVKDLTSHSENQNLHQPDEVIL